MPFQQLHQTLEVVGVFDVRVQRIQADEAVHRLDRQFRFVVLEVRVGGVDHRLLGIDAVRKARFEARVVIDGLVVAAFEHDAARFAVEAFPPASRGIVRRRRLAAGREHGNAENHHGGA